MANNKTNYTFQIDTYTPETIPMNRLAEYLVHLATLFGEYKSVHFANLKKGSLKLQIQVDREAEPKVQHRIRSAACGDGDGEAGKAIRRLNLLLAQDNASALLSGAASRKILEFPGRKQFDQPVLGPIFQPGYVDGIPIRIGGEGDPVPVHLQDFEQPKEICHASREIARRIAPHIFTTMIRAEGTGKWFRDSEGAWTRERFTIESFQELRPVSLEEAVGQLRVDNAAMPNTSLLQLRALRTGKGVK